MDIPLQTILSLHTRGFYGRYDDADGMPAGTGAQAGGDGITQRLSNDNESRPEERLFLFKVVKKGYLYLFWLSIPKV